MFWGIISVILGLVVGSFLNVVINRIKLNQSVNGRSHCPHCKTELRPVDLVPVFSYIFLRGRCAHCHAPISPQYPLVEAGTALVFFLIQLKFPSPSIDLFFLWVISAFLIVIAVYDLKHFLILDKVVFPALAVAVIYAVARDFSSGCGANWHCHTISGIIGMAVASGFFYLQHVLSQGRWIGFGDVKLGLFLGMLAGFPLAIFTLFAAYIMGAAVGVGLIAAGKKEMGSKLPFGTFLALSAIITLLYGQGIFDTYLKAIGF
jgi:leader peptidase (prepilin peptidase)/N-methyltransferase